MVKIESALGSLAGATACEPRDEQKHTTAVLSHLVMITNVSDLSYFEPDKFPVCYCRQLAENLPKIDNLLNTTVAVGNISSLSNLEEIVNRSNYCD
jgi:hypothetical protein